MDVVDEIRQRLDLVDVISQYVELKKAGHSYKGLCPFHTEKTPSFIVFPDTQTWHCFGSCGTGGDVFAFIMKQENLAFGEALRMLAERAGVELRPQTPQEQAIKSERDRLFEVNASAADFYNHLLLNDPRAEEARQYLTKRGLRPETLRAYQLGFAPDDWHVLEQRLLRLYPQSDLLKAGLLTQSDSGNIYDRFRGRIMFPIRDHRGRVMGFGGRVLNDSQPKYLNSPETPLFHKGSVLYGIDLARQAIRDTGTVVIVEGYMDVIVPYQEGVRNLVACLGTALTNDHIKILRGMTDRLLFALDPDTAGINATLRGVDAARDGLGHKIVPLVSADGVVRYENQLNAEIRVMTLPDGLDPDEVILRDRALWDQAVEEAVPFVDFVMRIVSSEEDLTTARGKRQFTERILPVIAAIDSQVEQSHYLQRLSQLVRVSEQVLAREMRRYRQRDSAQPVEAAETQRQPARALSIEDRVVGLLWLYPQRFEQVRSLSGIDAEAFQDVRNRALFEELLTLEKKTVEDSKEKLEWLDEELVGRVESTRDALTAGPAMSEDMAIEDLIKSALRMRKAHLSRSLAELRYALEDARQSGDKQEAERLGARAEEISREIELANRRAYEVTLMGKSRK